MVWVNLRNGGPKKDEDDEVEEEDDEAGEDDEGREQLPEEVEPLPRRSGGKVLP